MEQHSKTIKGILIGIGIAIVILVVFQAGMSVGYRKAAFSYRFGEVYFRDTFGRTAGPIGGHGAIGTIIRIDGQNIVVSGKDNVEKIVTVGTSTEIRHLQDTIAFSDLKIGDTIVLLGMPDDDGYINAHFIRVK